MLHSKIGASNDTDTIHRGIQKEAVKLILESSESKRQIALNPDLANFGMHLLDMKVDTIIATLVEARTVYEG